MNTRKIIEERDVRKARERKANKLLKALTPLIGDIREGARYDTRWEAVEQAYDAAVARIKRHAA